MDLDLSIGTKSPEFKLICENVQGNILRSHGRNFAWQLFIQFKSEKGARKCIRKHLRKRITSAGKQHKQAKEFSENSRKGNTIFCNLSFTNSGLAKLGVTKFSDFNDEFKKGAKSSIRKLNDPEEGKWQEELRVEYDCLLIMACASKKILNNSMNRLVKKLRPHTNNLHLEIGEGMKNAAGDHIEHFGYVDGISQPHLLSDKVDSGKVKVSTWNPIAKLKLALINDPLVKDSNALGSYLVFRKLEQNVKAFEEAVENLANKMNTDKSHAGAQMVGRFRNGMPLTLSPSPSPLVPPLNDPPGKMNDFDYSKDSEGSKCPFHAHIRKTNPRGSGGIQKNMVTPQMARRGITYGIDFRKQNIHPKEGVGLLFMAHMADIKSQFEFMQESWSNNSGFPPNEKNKPTGIDPIIGQPDQTEGNYYTTWGKESSRKREKPSMKRFVTMKGGVYLYTPSIAYLKTI